MMQKIKKCDALENVCGGCIKKTRRVAGGVILFIMIIFGDVQRVINYFRRNLVLVVAYD